MCVIGEAPAAATAVARPIDTAPKPAFDDDAGPPLRGKRWFHERRLRRAQRRHVDNDGNQPAFN
jgi:hypothetical protein